MPLPRHWMYDIHLQMMHRERRLSERSLEQTFRALKYEDADSHPTQGHQLTSHQVQENAEWRYETGEAELSSEFLSSQMSSQGQQT